MKIGIFDSGLGGLVISKSFKELMPEYDYVYYGDTKNLPYGDKDSTQILHYTIDAVKFLISQKCGLIIIACNTATAIALRYIQQRFIPSYAPDVKVLGVVIPTVEEAIQSNTHHIGVLATEATINSHIYKAELQKINPEIKITEIAAPKLVPAIEGDNFDKAKKDIINYFNQFNDVDSLILGCTHHPLLKTVLRQNIPGKIHVISQDELMGKKLKDYLQRHIDIDICLSRNSELKVWVSSINSHYSKVANRLFPGVVIKEVKNA